MTEIYIKIFTSGLPETDSGKFYPPQELSKYDSARLIGINYTVGNITKLRIIKGESGPELTKEDIERYGLDRDTVLSEFYMHLASAETVICYNSDFVINVIKSESFRNNREEIVFALGAKKIICVLKLLEKIYGFRPSFKAAYQKVFGIPKIYDSINLRHLYLSLSENSLTY